jgi:hypothetical protein
MTDPVPINKGVRQGCLLSPGLFGIYAKFMMERALGKSNEGVWVNGERIKAIKFADDQAIISGSVKSLQNMLTKINKASDTYGMKINKNKTKIMSIGKEPKELSLNIEGQIIEQVKTYRYLGQTITEDARCEKEIKTRIAMAKKAFREKQRILTAKNTDLNLRKRILNAYVWSIALYGAETWTINKSDEKRLEAFEMWGYRRMERISWLDRLTNEEVLERVGEDRKIINIIRRRRGIWMGHALRHEGPINKVLEGKIQGKRGRGRPRNNFVSQLYKDTNTKTFYDLKRAAEIREGWRDMVHQLNNQS